MGRYIEFSVMVSELSGKDNSSCDLKLSGSGANLLAKRTMGSSWLHDLLNSAPIWPISKASASPASDGLPIQQKASSSSPLLSSAATRATSLASTTWSGKTDGCLALNRWPPVGRYGEDADGCESILVQMALGSLWSLSPDEISVVPAMSCISSYKLSYAHVRVALIDCMLNNPSFYRTCQVTV